MFCVGLEHLVCERQINFCYLKEIILIWGLSLVEFFLILYSYYLSFKSMVWLLLGGVLLTPASKVLEKSFLNSDLFNLWNYVNALDGQFQDTYFVRH